MVWWRWWRRFRWPPARFGAVGGVFARISHDKIVTRACSPRFGSKEIKAETVEGLGRRDGTADTGDRGEPDK
jgi:hypothetical protein